MAASAKSSMAALLLVVAVLAGTCASGAHGTDIVNLCDHGALIKIGGISVPGIPLLPNVPVPLVTALLDPVYITIDLKTYLIAKVDLDKLLALNLELKLSAKITIECDGKCGHGFLTIKVYIRPVFQQGGYGMNTNWMGVDLDLIFGDLLKELDGLVSSLGF